MQKILSAVILEKLSRFIITKLNAFLSDEENIKRAGKILTGKDVSSATNSISKGLTSLLAAFSKYIKYALLIVFTSWIFLIVLVIVGLYFLFKNFN